MAACTEQGASIAAAMYGQLDVDAKQLLDNHLRSCAGCRSELEELRETSRLIGRGAAELPKAEHAQIAARIAQRIELQGARRKPAYGPWIGAAAAAAAVAFMLWVVSTRQPPMPQEVVTAPVPPVATPEPAPVSPPKPVPPPKPVAPPVFVQPEPKPTPPAPPTPAPEEPKPAPVKEKQPDKPAPVIEERKTIVVVATVESVRGDAQVEGKPLKAGAEIAAGQTVQVVGRKSLLAIKYKDGTRVEIGPDTSVREETSAAGKRIAVLRGAVRADVARQAAGHPMIFASATAEARVLGTELTFAVGEAETRLEVREGRVKLTRLSDGAAVEVSAGHAAVARPGKPPAATLLRVSTGLQALYLFDEGQGGEVRDRSGAGEPLDLRIQRRDAVAWGGSGLAIKGNTHIASEGPATKIIEACRKTNEITLEAWVKPAKAAVEFDGTIVAMSVDNPERNFALLQGSSREDLSAWAANLRTSTTDNGGRPSLLTPKNSVEAKLTHVLYTRNAAGQDRLYLNGVERASKSRPGSFANWGDAFRLALGNEITEERPWQGEYRLVAVYSRALAPAEVARNFRCGAD